MNWQDAQDELDTMKFPEGDFIEMHENISHDKGKVSHVMKSYKRPLTVGEYPGEAKYSVCPKCKQVRNKVLRIFNNDLHNCYEKWLIFRGEEVKGKDISDIAEELFNY
jgi:hypothetical protein